MTKPPVVIPIGRDETPTGGDQDVVGMTMRVNNKDLRAVMDRMPENGWQWHTVVADPDHDATLITFRRVPDSTVLTRAQLEARLAEWERPLQDHEVLIAAGAPNTPEQIEHTRQALAWLLQSRRDHAEDVTRSLS
jgi:hypothetical protein